MIRRWRLVLAAVAFIGWLSYLGYAALTKNRGPVVSHIQVAAAKHAIVAEVSAGPDGKPDQHVTVVEAMSKDGPARDRRSSWITSPAPAALLAPANTYCF